MADPKREVPHNRPNRLHEALRKYAFSSLRHDYSFLSLKPLGSGTRGIIYQSTNPNVVIKAIDDPREPVVAARLHRLGLKHVVQVYGSFPLELVARQKDGTYKNTTLHLTYLEKLVPMSGTRLKAHEYLHEGMTDGKDHYHVPRAFLKVLAERTKSAPKKFKPYLGEFKELLEEVMDAGEWHRDFKLPNLMTDQNGTLKVSDIGSFTEKPLLIQRDPPISRQEMTEDAKALLAMAKRHASMGPLATAEGRLLKLAQRMQAASTAEPIRPTDQFGGAPDPFHDGISSEEVEDPDFVPEEILAIPTPQGGKWRTPNSPAGPTVRVPYRTVDINPDHSKMDGSDASRFPITQHRKG